MKKDDEISFATGKASVTKYKIVFVGDQGVGKSSIISRFIKNQFDQSHNPTVGIDFVSKNLFINDKTVRLQLWDTAGQERFRSLIPSYLKDCNAAFVVFDITSSNSFQSIGKWIDFVKESRGNDCLIFVIGNKLDLEADRNVNTEKAEAQMKAQGINYYEVSAKSGRNLNETFRSLCSILMNVPVDNMVEKMEKPPKKQATKSNLPQPLKNQPKSPANERKPATTTLTKQGSERIKQKGCCQ